MEKIQLTAEVVVDTTNETESTNEIRPLKDLELLLAGGGSDGGVIWG